jgi:hypothetical protein
MRGEDYAHKKNILLLITREFHAKITSIDLLVGIPVAQRSTTQFVTLVSSSRVSGLLERV